MKAKRQNSIIRLVEEHVIETQDELIEKLTEEGYSVTQATISRDIRELKISKMLGKEGRYHYVLPVTAPRVIDTDLRNTYMSSVTQILCGGNIVIVKTHPGLAQAVAAGLDSMKIPEILGCVAGDDTILAVTADAEIAAHLRDTLLPLIK